MLYVKMNKQYYDKLEDWMYDIDKDHSNFADILQELYKSYTGEELFINLPYLKQLANSKDWKSIVLWNYRIHLSLYDFMAELGARLTPPIVVIPKILKASSEEDAIYKEYLMHRDIEQFLISLGGS
ncbi:MAG: hypothetical protein LM575_05915 [Caldimicrobium sp.]|nr:hypothetical protein [Caldimicrobium sp.]